MRTLHKDILILTIVLGALSAGIYSIVWAGMNWHRGIYAGQHFGNARNTAYTTLLSYEGSSHMGSIEEGKPNVLNTHVFGKYGGPQMRLFRFIVNGKLICVGTWHSGQSSQVLQKCHT